MTMSKLTSPADTTGVTLISSYVAAANRDEKTLIGLFGQLRNYALTVIDVNSVVFSVEQVRASLEASEHQYGMENHAGDASLWTKNGKLKSTKIFPKSYISAKSTILRALEQGITIAGRGKTDLEQELKGLSPRTPLTWEDITQRFLIDIGNYREALTNASSTLEAKDKPLLIAVATSLDLLFTDLEQQVDRLS